MYPARVCGAGFCRDYEKQNKKKTMKKVYLASHIQARRLEKPATTLVSAVIRGVVYTGRSLMDCRRQAYADLVNN